MIVSMFPDLEREEEREKKEGGRDEVDVTYGNLELNASTTRALLPIFI
jgi:hypothetical protein